MIRFFVSVWENFKEYIVLVVLLIVSLILLSQNSSQGIQKVRSIAFGTFATVTSVFTDILNISNLKNENENLIGFTIIEKYPGIDLAVFNVNGKVITLYVETKAAENKIIINSFQPVK